MQRHAIQLLFLCVLPVASCEMPHPLERDRFPPPDETGYVEVIDPSLNPTAAVGPTPTVGCPEDITLIFKRPMQRGGCQGTGCHSPGNTGPDLISPGQAERLLGVPSQCNGRPYIAVDDSFLLDKISGSPPECGSPMPFSMPDALSAADEACIVAWIDELLAQ